MVGVLSLIGYAVDAEFLYSWYAFGSVAVHTALGLSVLGGGLVAAGASGVWRTPSRSDEARITRAAALAFLVAVATAGVASFAILQTQVRDALGQGLRLAQAERVAHIATSLALRSERAAMVAADPEVRHSLARLAVDGGDAAARQAFARAAAGFLAHGFTSVGATLPDGTRVLGAGAPARAASLTLRLDMQPPSELLWADRLVLRQRLAVTDGGRAVGTLAVEQRLDHLLATLAAPSSAWATAEFILCRPDATAIRCLPTRLHGHPLVLPATVDRAPLLAHRGLAEGPGFYSALDYRGHRVLGYVSPVGALGLLAIEKVDASEIYGPLGRRFLVGAALMIGLATAGTLVVRRHLGPLAAGLEERVRARTAALQETVGELRASEARFRALIETAAQIVWTATADGTSDDTPSWRAFTGQTVAEWREGGWMNAVHPEDRDAIAAMWERAVATQRAFTSEYRVRRADGVWRWMAARATPVFDAIDAPVGWVGMNVDVQDARDAADALHRSRDELETRVAQRTGELSDSNTALRASQERMAASLQEKEALLKEIHHRVKNNLQVMASLLNLQRHRSDLPAVHAAIDDARDRIAAIALLHEKLYRSADLARVDAGEYLRDLGERLGGDLAVSARVRIRVDCDPLPLSADRAIPCGLIVNELLSNACKHAFADGRQGTVRIALRRAAARTAVLEVADDGCGLPADIEPAASPGLGLQLAATFAEQLGGRLEVDRRAGTSFTVTFPVEPAPDGSEVPA